MTFKEEILNSHNRYRAQVGVPPLRWSEDLVATAQKWADKLAQTGKLEHSKAGENLAQGTTKPSTGLFIGGFLRAIALGG